MEEIFGINSGSPFVEFAVLFTQLVFLFFWAILVRGFQITESKVMRVAFFIGWVMQGFLFIRIVFFGN